MLNYWCIYNKLFIHFIYISILKSEKEFDTVIKGQVKLYSKDNDRI